MKFAAAALFLLTMTMAGAASNNRSDTQATAANAPVSAKSLALAQQLNNDTGGFEKVAHMGTQVMMGIGGPGFITSPQLYLTAYQRALDAHRDDISRANALIAESYARMFTQQELADKISFWESPLGRSIRQKQEASAVTISSGHFAPPALTPEEKSALTAFDSEKENGAAQKIKLFMQMRADIAPFLQSIAHDAMENYCKGGGDCSKIHIPALPPPAK